RSDGMLRPLAAGLLDLVLPPTCAVCGEVADGLCLSCATSLPPSPCRAPPSGVDHAAALAAHAGAAREVVAALKYRHHRDALAVLGPALARLATTFPGGRPDAVTWAATTPARQRRRGADQAQLLASEVARWLSRPSRRLVARRPGVPQSGQGRADRLGGPAYRPVDDAPQHVLVVDDVWTTGATLAAAAVALRAAGATRVDAVTVTVRP
ncbi:MAG: ComF family protein, partial [Actinomycetes bacterium]